MPLVLVFALPLPPASGCVDTLPRNGCKIMGYIFFSASREASNGTISSSQFAGRSLVCGAPLPRRNKSHGLCRYLETCWQQMVHHRGRCFCSSRLPVLCTEQLSKLLFTVQKESCEVSGCKPFYYLNLQLIYGRRYGLHIPPQHRLIRGKASAQAFHTMVRMATCEYMTNRSKFLSMLSEYFGSRSSASVTNNTNLAYLPLVPAI